MKWRNPFNLKFKLKGVYKIVLKIDENYEKLNFIWSKKQKFHIILLFGMNTHKDARRQ